MASNFSSPFPVLLKHRDRRHETPRLFSVWQLSAALISWIVEIRITAVPVLFQSASLQSTGTLYIHIPLEGQTVFHCRHEPHLHPSSTLWVRVLSVWILVLLHPQQVLLPIELVLILLSEGVCCFSVLSQSHGYGITPLGNVICKKPFSWRFLVFLDLECTALTYVSFHLALFPLGLSRRPSFKHTPVIECRVVVASVWKVPHRLTCLNTWFPS